MSHMTFKMVTFLVDPLILAIYLKSDGWDRVLNEPSLNEQGQFGLGSLVLLRAQTRSSSC